MKKLILFLGMTFLGFQLNFAQTTIFGKVINKADKQPVPGATVKVKEKSDVSATTDNNGKYSIAVPKEGKNLEVSATGFKTQTKGLGDKKEINFELSSTAPGNTKPKENKGNKE